MIIVGAGISGSYLAKLLKPEGVEYTLYDSDRRRGHRCAWITHYSLMREKLVKVGLNIDNYMLCRIKQCYLNGVKIKLKNSIVIDKPKLLEDLRKGIKIYYKSIDVLRPRKKMVINATGKPLGKAYYIDTYQKKVKTVEMEKETAHIHINFGKAGYAWTFPLNEEGDLFHVGAVCYKCSPHDLISGLYERYRITDKHTFCTCTKNIHVFRPKELDIITRNIVSIGEAAGCVYPITGEGILPAMETAEWLAYSLKHGTYPLDYSARIRKMHESYSKAWRAWRIMEKHPRLGSVLGLVDNMKRAGIMFLLRL